MKNILPTEYSSFLLELKERIHKAQYAALKVVNKELISPSTGTSASRSSAGRINWAGARRLWKRWRRIYSKLAETIFSIDHPIYGMLFNLQALDVVRIIEGRENEIALEEGKK